MTTTSDSTQTSDNSSDKNPPSGATNSGGDRPDLNQSDNNGYRTVDSDFNTHDYSPNAETTRFADPDKGPSISFYKEVNVVIEKSELESRNKNTSHHSDHTHSKNQDSNHKSSSEKSEQSTSKTPQDNSQTNKSDKSDGQQPQTDKTQEQQTQNKSGNQQEQNKPGDQKEHSTAPQDNSQINKSDKSDHAQQPHTDKTQEQQTQNKSGDQQEQNKPGDQKEQSTQTNKSDKSDGQQPQTDKTQEQQTQNKPGDQKEQSKPSDQAKEPSLSDKAFDATDKLFNPNARDHPAAAAITKNLSDRGEALVNHEIQSVLKQGETTHKVAENLAKGNLGEAANIAINHVGGNVYEKTVGTVIGFGKLVTHTGDAMGDLAYGITHQDEPGAATKIGKSATDIVMDVPNIILTADGAIQGIGGVAGAARVAGGAVKGAEAVEGATKGNTAKPVNTTERPSLGPQSEKPPSNTTGDRPSLSPENSAKPSGESKTPSSDKQGGNLPQSSEAGLPPVQHLPPGRARGLPKDVTAQPKGGTPATRRDAAALADRGVNPRNAYPSAPQHHIFPQQFRDWFESKGIEIDKYTVELSQGEHSATHTSNKSLDYEGWNQEWQSFKDAHQGATEQQMFEQAGKMMDKYNLSDLPIRDYKK